MNNGNHIYGSPIAPEGGSKQLSFAPKAQVNTYTCEDCTAQVAIAIKRNGITRCMKCNKAAAGRGVAA